jgi:hypothetical protein
MRALIGGTMVRMTRVALLLGSVAAILFAFTGVGRAGDTSCTIATKGDSPVAKACTEGGIKKAKAVMKKMVKDAKAGGFTGDCDDCHKDDAKFDLTDDAAEKFKKMLAAIGTKKIAPKK